MNVKVIVPALPSPAIPEDHGSPFRPVIKGVGDSFELYYWLVVELIIANMVGAYDNFDVVQRIDNDVVDLKAKEKGTEKAQSDVTGAN